MRIEFTENPLVTKIYLDEKEKYILEKNLRIEILEDKLVEINYNLENGKEVTEEILDIEIEEELQRMLKLYEEGLLDSHGGDCIKMPCSCIKCWSEQFSEVDTLPSFDSVKFSTKIGYETFMLFKEHNTLDDAIENAKDETKAWLTEYKVWKKKESEECPMEFKKGDFARVKGHKRIIEIEQVIINEFEGATTVVGADESYWDSKNLELCEKEQE